MGSQKEFVLIYDFFIQKAKIDSFWDNPRRWIFAENWQEKRKIAFRAWRKSKRISLMESRETWEILSG